MSRDSKDTLACSVVLSTRNKANYLDRTLASIREQDVPFEYELIIVDDGSTDNTKDICEKYKAQYRWLPNPRYRNPSVARNVGYRAARGNVIICQSDDVIHITPNTIEILTTELRKGEFLLANVENHVYSHKGKKRYVGTYCSPEGENRRPYLFLGSLWRKDLYAIGGCDEDFIEPCFDDNWFANCLMKGLKLSPRFITTVLGHHQSHTFVTGSHANTKKSRNIYYEKLERAKKTQIYVSSGGSWKYYTHPSVSSSLISFSPLPKLPIPQHQGKIIRHMNFFWSGGSLSFMRYLTIRSFRQHHPDWGITLHSSKTTGRKWKSSQSQDDEVYQGSDYHDGLRDLNISFQSWELPISDLAPAHASDLCQWNILYNGYGFYSDMDILFVRSLPYEKLCQSNAVFCLTLGYMTIGFLASSPRNPIFRDVLKEAVDNYCVNEYQSTGAFTFYRLAGIGHNWPKVSNPGEIVLSSLRKRYLKEKITILPPVSFYPWNYLQTDHIFNQHNSVPRECIGIHWFGGNPLSQHWNCKLTPQNLNEYSNTFTSYVRELLK